MTRTRLLIWILVVVVMLQLFPDKAGRIELFAVIAVALYGAAWGIPKYLARRKNQTANAALAQSDEEEFRRYTKELDAIKAKFDPQRDLDDPTSISPEYQEAITALLDKHDAMLKRKFGPPR